MADEYSEGPNLALEFREDCVIDLNTGKRWALSCTWPPTGLGIDIPAALCIDQERRKRAWADIKLTNQWTGDTEENWQKRQAELQAARDEYDRQIAARKRDKEHPGEYWDPTTKTWEKRAVTVAVKITSPKGREPLPGWPCPGFGTTCCMAICEGGSACMMQAGPPGQQGEVA